MKVYVLTKLEDCYGNTTDVDVRGVYGREDLAMDALADWIMELAKEDGDFSDCLLHDENHEDIPKRGNEKIRKYVREEAGGYCYYVWAYDSSYKFDIFEKDLDVPEM